MTAANTDRTLLFGLLALHLDFVSREDLIEALKAWVLKKESTLGEILVKQGAWSEERCALLESLVQEHLRQHGDDPCQSLATIPPTQSIQADLRQIADPALCVSLTHVPETRHFEERLAASPGPLPRHSSSTGLRFRVLRAHARGGLGQVSVALDEELHREVAFKEIQDRHADELGTRSRFVQEAEITGGLEHPGIVPVYGLG